MRKSPSASTGGFIPGVPCKMFVSPGFAPTGVSFGVPGASGERCGAGDLAGRGCVCAFVPFVGCASAVAQTMTKAIPIENVLFIWSRDKRNKSVMPVKAMCDNLIGHRAARR